MPLKKPTSARISRSVNVGKTSRRYVSSLERKKLRSFGFSGFRKSGINLRTVQEISLTLNRNSYMLHMKHSSTTKETRKKPSPSFLRKHLSRVIECKGRLLGYAIFLLNAVKVRLKKYRKKALIVF